MGSWSIEVLALNWCYYKLENLLVPEVGGRSLATYLEWLLVIGLGIATAMQGILSKSLMVRRFLDLRAQRIHSVHHLAVHQLVADFE